MIKSRGKKLSINLSITETRYEICEYKPFKEKTRYYYVSKYRFRLDSKTLALMSNDPVIKTALELEEGG